MRAALLITIALAACGPRDGAPPASSAPITSPPPPTASAPPFDCSIFERMKNGDFEGMSTLDPGQFWMGFEECHARGKPPCERAWALLLAMPSMASPSEAELAKQEAAYLRACRTLPEAEQRCLTAYAIAHPEICEPLKAREKLQAAERAAGH